MGWWRGEDGESIVGDGPVDFVMDGHNAVAADRRQAGKEGPPPDALFDAAARVLRAAGDLPEPDDWPKPPREDWADDELPVLEQALRELVGEYEMSELQRGPTAREIYETLDFAVGVLS